jgi:hypothetical protein
MSASLARAKAPEFTTDAVMPSGDFGKVSLKELTAGGKCVQHIARSWALIASSRGLLSPRRFSPPRHYRAQVPRHHVLPGGLHV